MHIRIVGDNSISQRNHAVIVYDPKKETFIYFQEMHQA